MKFEPQIAAYKPGVQYEGASSGLLDPGAVAETVFGPTLSYGTLMAYCFRRFGPSPFGSDNYKEIVRWNLTTPLEDLFLSISINGLSRTQLLFGYQMTHDLHLSLANEHQCEVETLHANFRTWLREAHGEDYDDMKKTMHETEGRELWSERWDAFNAADSSPVSTPLKDQAEAALLGTIQALKSPTWVRDVPIDATGGVSDEVAARGDCAPFEKAGYGVPSLLRAAPEMLFRLTEAAERIGVEHVVEMLEEAGQEKQHVE